MGDEKIMGTASPAPNVPDDVRHETVYVVPGGAVSVRFECKRCESMRWPTRVKPAANAGLHPSEHSRSHGFKTPDFTSPV